ncbi:DMT family transporter [Aureimonas populi]|uniref:DMT family transporter n=1 Tax=Aureimonas populi TaxID=1701758 RepID=A0ABW5CNS0_9HYPH|nr:DMT family transporter [Aureimonas populi]
MPPSKTLLFGILTTIVAGVLFASMDSLGKYLMGDLPIIQVVWARYAFHTILMGAYLAATTGKRFLHTNRPGLQVARGASLLATTGLMYSSLSRAPLADATAALFMAPIVVTLLSVLLLKEKIGPRRIGAIIAGFVGVLFILRPGLGAVEPFVLLAALAAFTNATYLLLTRALAGADDAASTQFNTTAVGAVMLTFAVFPFWQAPQAWQFALMVAMGGIGALGHFILVVAFSRAPASLLSPFLYSQVLAAAILSVTLFGDPLHPAMVLGTVLLVGSGLYIWWRENR